MDTCPPPGKPLRAWEIREGLWRWIAGPSPCPRGDVVSTYCEAGEAIVLVDPIVPPEGSADHERFFRALDSDVARLSLPLVVLATCAEHARDAEGLVARYHARPGASSGSTDLPEGAAVIRSGDELALHLPSHRIVIVGHAPAPAEWAGHDGLVLGAHDAVEA